MEPTLHQSCCRANCTLVVPTYNAAPFIEQTASSLQQFVANHPGWQVLFVCDGCTDDTVPQLMRCVGPDQPAIRVEAYDRNRGKGHALRRGLSLAQTPYRVFTDVDLAYDLDGPLRLVELLEAGADLALANRASPESTFHISPRDFPNIYKRHLMSRAFNWWLRQMLPITVLDTQAGLKGITAAAWERLAPYLTSDGFFFDVELLARAARAGMSMAETPVHFRYVDPTTVRMVRHGWSMILDTLKLKHALRAMPRAAQPVPRPAAELAR